MMRKTKEKKNDEMVRKIVTERGRKRQTILKTKNIVTVKIIEGNKKVDIVRQNENEEERRK